MCSVILTGILTVLSKMLLYSVYHFNRRTIVFSISLQAIWVSKGKANMMANWVLEWRRQENATSSLRYNSRVPN